MRPLPAETVIVNARVRTMRADTDTGAAASAVAVAHGRIAAIGTETEARRAVSPGADVIDAAGATLTPGLIDSHAHPTWGADLTVGVDLGGLDRAGALAALRAEAGRLPDDAWVRGWNLDYKVFGAAPVSGSVLEEAVSGRPTALLFYDLHTAVGTRAAMRAAGLTGAREFADTSQVVVDCDGAPTGELREPPAYNLLLDAAPPLTPEKRRSRSMQIFGQMNRCGLTGAAIMDGTAETLALLDTIESGGELPLRLAVALWHRPDSDDAEVDGNIARLGAAGRRWSCSMIKMFIDGVIDTGTAWLHEPDTCGQGRHSFWPSIDRYRDVVRRYTEAGFQIATHACGDQGVAAALDAYEMHGARASSGAPHRIEHLETLTDDEVRRIAASGVIASMQPLHMQWREGDESDSWADRLGPDRAAHGFRIRDILTAGGRTALGSDWPVASFDPRVGMAWARLRRTPGDPDAPVFEPAERLSGEEALLGYTRWAASALGRSDIGTLTPGARADLTLFAGDPVTTEADELIDLPVQLTMTDGQIVHRDGV
ncbi:amidohydrolase [Spelaeicoccus albus]|uniref:Amidohydrolase 3 domain-containing protein n=1 Tax=Spelaeicoccus albus TaxID=1280376 RepID=A0A7Z0D0B8_9MICO|nr:amidohydrolase [Spelaeicoccus albus]NYI67164.1 hypothetical protein [Spelaeicoccus albus]